MTTIEDKLMSLKKHYQSMNVSVNGNNVDVTLTDAMFSLKSPGIGILLPITESFEIRAVQKGVVELRMFFNRDRLESAVANAEEQRRIL